MRGPDEPRPSRQLRVDAVIVAAGSSTRMGGQDKIRSTVGDRPLVAWSLRALAAARSVERIVLVVPAEHVAGDAAAAWLPDSVVAVVAGGPRRQDSVAAGIRWLDDHDGRLDQGASDDRRDRVILVHDGARPLVTAALVDGVAAAAGEHGAAIPVLAVAETLKRVVDGRIVETVERASLAAAQTPQGVRRDLLERAWTRFPPDGPRTFTDEASLLEACRIPVHAIPGEPDNVKVTLPADLVRVGATLAPAGPRIGFGHDVHPFGPSEPLRLGGIDIPRAPRLFGHSDGDVALHALADALLGAAGQGDLGRLFPADARTPRGIDSVELLAEVVARLKAAGLQPATVDMTIVAGRPRLAAHLPAIQDRVAGILGLDVGSVNVKASTGNLDGSEGAGRSISAEVIATVLPRRPLEGRSPGRGSPDRRSAG